MTVTHGNDPDVLDGIGDALRAQAERMQTIAATGTTGVAASSRPGPGRMWTCSAPA